MYSSQQMYSSSINSKKLGSLPSIIVGLTLICPFIIIILIILLSNLISSSGGCIKVPVIITDKKIIKVYPRILQQYYFQYNKKQYNISTTEPNFGCSYDLNKEISESLMIHIMKDQIVCKCKDMLEHKIMIPLLILGLILFCFTFMILINISMAWCFSKKNKYE